MSVKIYPYGEKFNSHTDLRAGSEKFSMDKCAVKVTFPSTWLERCVFLLKVIIVIVTIIVNWLYMTVYFFWQKSQASCRYFLYKLYIKMAWKYNITFHATKFKNDTVNFEESLDPYSAFRKASEDSTVPDQPLWGLLVWQVVGIFLLGLVLVCK